VSDEIIVEVDAGRERRGPGLPGATLALVDSLIELNMRDTITRLGLPYLIGN